MHPSGCTVSEFVDPSGWLLTLVWLAALLLAFGFALAGAGDLKWRLFNLAITLGCMSIGYGLGYAAGLGSKNLGSVPHAALPFSMMFGVVAALACVWGNSARGKD
jgi:hypothetical protein